MCSSCQSIDKLYSYIKFILYILLHVEWSLSVVVVNLLYQIIYQSSTVYSKVSSDSYMHWLSIYWWTTFVCQGSTVYSKVNHMCSDCKSIDELHSYVKVLLYIVKWIICVVIANILMNYTRMSRMLMFYCI